MQAGTFEWKQGIFILQFLRSWAIEGIKQHLHGHRTVILQEVGSSRIWSLFHSQQCKPFPVKKIVLRSTANCASTSRFRFDCSVRGAGAYQGRLRKAWGPWQNAPFCYPPSPSMARQTGLRSQSGILSQLHQIGRHRRYEVFLLTLVCHKFWKNCLDVFLQVSNFV